MLKHLNFGVLLTTLVILSVANGLFSEEEEREPFKPSRPLQMTSSPFQSPLSFPSSRSGGRTLSMPVDQESYDAFAPSMKALINMSDLMARRGNGVTVSTRECCFNGQCRQISEGEICRGLERARITRVVGTHDKPLSDDLTPKNYFGAEYNPKEKPYENPAKILFRNDSFPKPTVKNPYKMPEDNDNFARQKMRYPYDEQNEFNSRNPSQTPKRRMEEDSLKTQNNPYEDPGMRYPYGKKNNFSAPIASKTPKTEPEEDSTGTQSVLGMSLPLEDLFGSLLASRFPDAKLQRVTQQGFYDPKTGQVIDNLSDYNRQKWIPKLGKYAVTPKELPVEQHDYVNPAGYTEEEVEQIRKNVLERTNLYRNKHSVGELVLNDNLNYYAQEWANTLASLNAPQHRDQDRYGENIFYTQLAKDEIGNDAVDSWYNELERVQVGFGEEELSDRSKKIGHMTQTLWSDTKEMGVGVAKSADGRCYIVANYNPPGNVKHFYVENLPTFTQEEIDKAKNAQKALDKKLQTPVVFRMNSGRIRPFSYQNSPFNEYFGTHNSNPLVAEEDDVEKIKRSPKPLSGLSNNNNGTQKKPSVQPSFNGSTVKPSDLNSQFARSKKAHPKSMSSSSRNPGEDNNLPHSRTYTNKSQQHDPREIIDPYASLEKIDDLSDIPKKKIISENSLGKRVARMPEVKPAIKFLPQTRLNVTEKEYEIIRNDVYQKTNFYRKQYGYNPLKLNKLIDNYAQDWANTLANARQFKHRRDLGYPVVYGENIHKSIVVKHVGELAVDAWYFETAFVGEQNNEEEFDSNVNNAGHLFQLLWRSSTEMGIGVAKSIDNRYYIVANYNPPGNCEHFFVENLPRLINKNEIIRGVAFQKLLERAEKQGISKLGDEIPTLDGWKSDLYND